MKQQHINKGMLETEPDYCCWKDNAENLHLLGHCDQDCAFSIPFASLLFMVNCSVFETLPESATCLGHRSYQPLESQAAILHTLPWA